VERGDLVTIAVSGDYGKPRPALIIQADAFRALPSVTVLRLSSEVIPAHPTRITIAPNPENGLRTISQVMIDKAVTVPRNKIGRVFGRLDDATLSTINRALAALLGLDGD
jgi:mRNA interferase MazF